MINVADFVGFMRRKDLGRMKFALREIHFDLNSTDEVKSMFRPVNFDVSIYFGWNFNFYTI